MATPLADLLDGVLHDAEVRAEFAASPEVFLHEHGYAELDAADVQEALFILADGAPPAEAAALNSGGRSIDDLDDLDGAGLGGAAAGLAAAVASITGDELLADDPADLDGLPDHDTADDPDDLDAHRIEHAGGADDDDDLDDDGAADGASPASSSLGAAIGDRITPEPYRTDSDLDLDLDDLDDLDESAGVELATYDPDVDEPAGEQIDLDSFARTSDAPTSPAETDEPSDGWDELI